MKAHVLDGNRAPTGEGRGKRPLQRRGQCFRNDAFAGRCHTAEVSFCNAVVVALGEFEILDVLNQRSEAREQGLASLHLALGGSEAGKHANVSRPLDGDCLGINR